MEVFTFLKVTSMYSTAALQDRCIVRPIVDLRHTTSALQQIALLAEVADKFAKFDANAADCFKAEDKDRLLGVIEGSFGSLERFNVVVRKALTSVIKIDATPTRERPMQKLLRLTMSRRSSHDRELV